MSHSSFVSITTLSPLQVTRRSIVDFRVTGGDLPDFQEEKMFCAGRHLTLCMTENLSCRVSCRKAGSNGTPGTYLPLSLVIPGAMRILRLRCHPREEAAQSERRH